MGLQIIGGYLSGIVVAVFVIYVIAPILGRIWSTWRNNRRRIKQSLAGSMELRWK